MLANVHILSAFQAKEALGPALILTSSVKLQGGNHVCENGSGSLVLQHACKLGFEGIISKREDLALSVGSLAGLDQAEEPQDGSEAGSRSELGEIEAANNALGFTAMHRTATPER
jgi:hypothetical protein